MSTQLTRAALTFTVAVGFAGWAASLSARADDKTAIHVATELKWQEGLPALPSGAKIAMLEGDLSKPGPFTYRIKMPDGYKIPPHKHTMAERITIISGTYHLGEGEKFDKNQAKTLPAGSYASWPAGTPHFSWAEGETVIQVHGEGPWILKYVNPEDDPRKNNK